jgi:hypothetical protein
MIASQNQWLSIHNATAATHRNAETAEAAVKNLLFIQYS